MLFRMGIVIICSLFFAPIFLAAGVIHVPGDQPTIQDGIDAASNGDTVLVADGTYTGTGNIDLDFGGKIISLQSENGPSGCIINCQNNGRGFTFHSGENKDAMVHGFTIQNGYTLDNGGGISCDSSSPTIMNNVFSGNTAAFYGGGVYCYNASPKIIYNTFTGNSADEDGGGIYCNEASPEIAYNTFSGNTADYDGGAIACLTASPEIMHNVISGNAAPKGGGFYCRDLSSPIISNNLITGNWASAWGGGMYILASSPTLNSNTISGNIAGFDGGGICCHHIDSFPTVTDSVLWGNTATTGNELFIAYSSTFTISYSDVEGGQAAAYVETGSTLNWGSGMMDNDPLFVTGSMGDYYLSHIAAGDASDSPCVDAGSVTIGLQISGNRGIPAGTARTDHVLDSGVLDLGYHYSVIGIAEAGGPYSDRAKQAIIFDASKSFDPYGTIVEYRWDWTNDGTWDTAWLTDPVITHTYHVEFHGQARLQVKDSDDYTDTDLAEVTTFPPISGGKNWLVEIPE